MSCPSKRQGMNARHACPNMAINFDEPFPPACGRIYKDSTLYPTSSACQCELGKMGPNNGERTAAGLAGEALLEGDYPWRAFSTPRRNQSIYARRGRSELSPDRGRVSNRAFAFCHGRSESRGHPLPTDTLAEVLLSRVPQVVSARRGLIIEGGAKWRSSIAPHCSHCLRTVARSTTCWVRRAIAL